MPLIRTLQSIEAAHFAHEALTDVQVVTSLLMIHWKASSLQATFIAEHFTTLQQCAERDHFKELADQQTHFSAKIREGHQNNTHVNLALKALLTNRVSTLMAYMQVFSREVVQVYTDGIV